MSKKDMKFDGGKPLAAIPFADFPDAIMEMVEVCTMGANKYERTSWKTVQDAETRYTDAMSRHFLQSFTSLKDEESGCSHLAHLAWGALAVLQLQIERGALEFDNNNIEVLKEINDAVDELNKELSNIGRIEPHPLECSSYSGGSTGAVVVGGVRYSNPPVGTPRIRTKARSAKL